MTPNEANLIRWMERKGGMVTDTALARQFGESCHIEISSLLRHQCIEQDRHHLKVTTVGEDALAAFDAVDKAAPSKRAPFEGRPQW